MGRFADSHLHLFRAKGNARTHDTAGPPSDPNGHSPDRPKVLLAGVREARPEGLERALIRAGYEIAESDPELTRLLAADAVLLAGAQYEDAARELAVLQGEAPRGLPLLVLLRHAGAEDVVRLLSAGAAEVMVSGIDLAELCARLDARVRESREALRARRVGEQTARLFDTLQDVVLGARSEEVLHTLVLRLGRSLDLLHCSGVFWTVGQRQGRLVARNDKPSHRDAGVDPSSYPEMEEAVRRGEAVLVPDVAHHPLFATARAGAAHDALTGVGSAAAVPLQIHGKTVGAIVLRSRRPDELAWDQLTMVERLVTCTGRLLEGLDRRAAIDRRWALADLRDPLTGCASLDALDHRIKEEADRARRYGLSFSLVLLDVEGLESLNQRFGMEAGDRALADLGGLLQREIRGPDFVARYGGDEFALILPETTLEGARRSIQRVRTRVTEHLFADLGPGEPVRLSAGIVSFPHPAAIHPEDLFALAEQALAEAKVDNGDRIGVATSGVPA